MSPKEQIITRLAESSPGAAALTALADLGRELGIPGAEPLTAGDVAGLTHRIRLAIAGKARAPYATGRQAFGVGP